jgi:hypothetical protein
VLRVDFIKSSYFCGFSWLIVVGWFNYESTRKRRYDDEQTSFDVYPPKP